MSDPNERDAKLVQYLNEAYGKERELETALQVDIAVTTKKPYAKRLKQHLKETKSHAKALEKRIKQLGGGGTTVQTVVGKATAAVKGPLHAIRGDGDDEKMLKNAKTQYFNEHEEISTYLALETFATKVGDKETASLARSIRKEEERMASFLEREIRSLANATAIAEVPARLRRSAAPKARTKRSRKADAKPASKSSAKAGSKKASPKKAAKKVTRAASKSKAAAKTTKTAAKSAKTSAKKSAAGRKGGKAAAKK